MSIEVISFLVALLVLLVFGFIYMLNFSTKVELGERLGSVKNVGSGFKVSGSSFGRFYQEKIQKKVSDSTLTRLSSLFGINMDAMQEKIELVGMEDSISAVEIVVLKIIGIIAGVALGVGAVSAKSMPLAIIAFVVFIALFFVPAEKITDKEKEREAEIMLELPVFIEQCYLCIEAGQTLREALEYVAAKTGGIVGKNFQDAFLRARYTGRWETEVTEMASVLKVSALEDFINDVLIASEKGVSIHETLRKEVGIINMLKRANDKERISAVSSKILLPMAFFFLLPMLAVVMAPALIECLAMLE